MSSLFSNTCSSAQRQPPEATPAPAGIYCIYERIALLRRRALPKAPAVSLGWPPVGIADGRWPAGVDGGTAAVTTPRAAGPVRGCSSAIRRRCSGAGPAICACANIMLAMCTRVQYWWWFWVSPVTGIRGIDLRRRRSDAPKLCAHTHRQGNTRHVRASGANAWPPCPCRAPPSSRRHHPPWQQMC
jgi:hypothetical protein